MEWNMLNESKKLFPHWLDKNENSNFSKHLSIINHQQLDMRHKLKCIEWSRLLNKPLQIHKTQTEPHKWEMEFEVHVKRLKQVNIYKNPTIVTNEVVDNYNVINGYYYDGVFYENHYTIVQNTDNTLNVENENEYVEPDIPKPYDDYTDEIQFEEGKYYYDLINKKYYIYLNDTLSGVDEGYVPKTSLIYSESYIDNYSRFFRHSISEDNSNEINIQKYVIDDDNEIKYKTVLDYNHLEDNGKYELTLASTKLFFNISSGKYCVFEDDEFIEIDDNDIIWSNDIGSEQIIDGVYYIFLTPDESIPSSKIPLIETEDITPIISDDKYVLEVFTWDDYHFLKGFPEIDFIDYNNNNIIDSDERNYDNINITIEEINDNDYLTFRVHQYGIKLIEIFKDGKPIHIADFLVEKLNYSDKQINSNFAHVYNYNDNQVYYPFLKDSDSLEEVNLDIDEYVWRVKLTDDDKIFDDNGKWTYELKNKYDIKVTYYDSSHPYDSEYDKILMKSYVYEDSIFYHDMSLDMIGALINVHRHIFRQPSLNTYNEKLDFYSKTYPTYTNVLSEDDYHYQRRLEYYINNYNKVYFPCLELWKYFHIDSELVNRKVVIAEQNYSYMRTLSPEEDKYINELGKNKLESFFLNDDYVSEEEEKNLKKPKLRSIIPPEDYLNSRNGILIDDEGNYIRDSDDGTLIRTDYVYNVYVNAETGEKEYYIEYENASRKFKWYLSELNNSSYQIKLTKSLRVVPNTKYQLRFCVKEYPVKELNLKLIYKNNKGDVRELVETTPERKDYDEIKEYNELVYTDYKKEWGISCEYICTDFLTLDTAQNIEIILESESDFKISDVTLQRVTINHFDSEYMKTTTDYNSCVYDLYADYTKIPSNLRYTDLNIFNKVLNRSLPLTKIGYFNFMLEDTESSGIMKLNTETRINMNNLIEIGVPANDFATVNVPNSDGIYQFVYRFNKYIKKGEYTFIFKPYVNTENNILQDFKIDIEMTVFKDDNTAIIKKITIENIRDYLVNDGEGSYFKFPFENESENSFSITISRNRHFRFKNAKLSRKLPLTMEELIV